MSLPKETLDRLGDMLRDCTALVTQLDGSKPAGSAFFVSETLLVTNRHVVGEGDDAADQPHKVKVHAYGGDVQEGVVLPGSDIEPELDIAVVQITDRVTSAVVMHRALDIGGYLLAGYPREDFYSDLNAGIEISPAEGKPRNDVSTKGVQLLRLTNVQIKPGYSGGPVLSTTTGAVVAVAVYSEDPEDNLGGTALPMERILGAYPELDRLAAEPPAATSRYREILERPRWEALGLVWDRDEQIDIYLTGNRSCWRIGVQPKDAGPERTVHDLRGDDMSEVLVQWARSSGRRDESEVRLLGRLLSAAIFAPVAGLFPKRADRNKDPVLIRLHVDPNGPLADLPWEFATDPLDPNRFLAAAEGYAFVRVNTGARVGSPRIKIRSPEKHVSVLTVVVQPESTTRWPSVVDIRRLTPWPPSKEIAQQLKSAISAPKSVDDSPVFTVEELINPTLFELEAHVASVDIVHYVGFGYQEPEDDERSGLDRSHIACWAGNSLEDDLRYHKAREVIEAIGAFGPKLVILEFGTPSLDQPYDRLSRGSQPIGAALLGAADLLEVDAMVCSRAMHPIQYDRFNQVFYRLLSAGQTVAQAVQRARQAVMTEAPVDFAGFGWFAVGTWNTPRSRFFDPPSRAAQTAPKDVTHQNQSPSPSPDSVKMADDGYPRAP